MILEEFKQKITEAEDKLDKPSYFGFCATLSGVHSQTIQSYNYIKSSHRVFKGIFEPKSGENYKWNNNWTSYWLGNCEFDSLSNKYGLDIKITRFIALGLFEQIVIDEKLYLEM